MEQIRRMRGGAQSHLMRCSDGKDHNLYFVVKFQNNPQHSRILVNELLGNRIAARMGLPVPRVEIVKVDPDLIRWTPALCIEMPRSSTPCCPGLQFGSGHPGDPRRMTLHDFLPDELLREVKNIHEFAGMLVFDKWTCNTNGRQTLFFRETRNGDGHRSPGGNGHRVPADVPFSSSSSPDASGAEGYYSTVMIDQGFCFNAGEWNYPDAPLRGLYARNRVYEGVTGMEAFEPYIRRIKNFTSRVLEEFAKEIPPEWYYDDFDALNRLLEQLLRRVGRLEELILDAKRSNRQPFLNWR
jgi:HipA-like protein